MELIFEWIMQQLTTNQFFGGFVGGSLIAGLLFILKDAPKELFKLYLRTFTIETEIFSYCIGFTWISEYLSSLDYAKKCRRLRIEENSGDVVLTIGTGVHFIKIDGVFVFIQKTLDKERSKGYIITESYKIRTFGRSQEIIRKVMESCKNRVYLQEKIPIHSWSNHGFWRLANKCNAKSLNSVILDNEMKDDLTKDIDWFLNSEKWYKERGIPWHRGYLLYGTPGTGKTSLTLALATHFCRPLYVLNLSSVSGDIDLEFAFSTCSSEGILLIEDIDAAQNSRKVIKKENNEEEKKESISLSSLLNQLDGSLSHPGLIIFMTSNHPEKLDPAILRPGRIDFKIHLGFLTPETAKNMINKFYPEINLEIESVGDVSPAEMQNVLQRYVSSSEDLKDILEREIEIKVA